MDWQGAIFGPGWVWSMLSMVLVVGSVIGLYRQLRLQSGANAWAQLGEIVREWDSERMTRYKLEVLLARRDRTGPSDLPAAAASTAADFWERVALLVRTGHVDRDLLYQQAALACQRWWLVLGPYIVAARVRHGHSKVGQNFEWLAGDFASSMRRDGSAVTFDEALLASTIDGMITGCRDDIRTWEALRSVPSASPAVGPATQPAADAPATPNPARPADSASTVATD